MGNGSHRDGEISRDAARQGFAVWTAPNLEYIYCGSRIEIATRAGRTDEIIEDAPLPTNPPHYNGWVVQELIETLALPFTEGCIIKYVARHKKKGGVDDLRKAKSYLDRLIEKEEKLIAGN
jgi:hypothetical protein